MFEKDCPVPESFRSMMGNILFLALLFFFAFIARFIFSPLMPVIESELDITHTQAGTLFFVMSIGFFVGQVFSGLLSSRVNHRGTLTLSSLCVGIALLVINLTSKAASVAPETAMPTSACFRAGASFTPSPVMPTMWPRA